VIVTIHEGIGGFIVPRAEAIEAGCGHAFRTAHGEFVAGKLLLHKLIEWFVRIQGADHIIAVAPDLRFRTITFVAVGIGVTRHIQPMSAVAFAIAIATQEIVDKG
jgi:hypothetical protein